MSFFFSGANSLGEPVFMRFSEAMVKEWFTPKGDGNCCCYALHSVPIVKEWFTPKGDGNGCGSSTIGSSGWLRNGFPCKGAETELSCHG